MTLFSPFSDEEMICGDVWKDELRKWLLKLNPRRTRRIRLNVVDFIGRKCPDRASEHAWASERGTERNVRWKG